MLRMRRVIAVVWLLAALVGCKNSALKPHADATGAGGSAGSGGDGGATGSGGASAGGAGGSVADASADISRADARSDAVSCGGTCVIPFASSSDWSVYDDDPVTNPAAQKLGMA